MDTLTIRRPDDFHVHLREGDLLRAVTGYTAHTFSRALVMPNTTRPILSADDLAAYRTTILDAVRDTEPGFEPLMTVKITPQTTPHAIEDASAAGAIAGKLYPDGVTTNSGGGVRDFTALYPVFAAMESTGMVLCLHGEMPGVFILDREEAFLSVLADIAARFPRLRIVMEHLSTVAAVRAVEALPSTVAATITVHHLSLTLDDVVGGLLAPHNFCKPIAKRPADRDALIAAATSGHPKFFLGTDSAPHMREFKECAAGCAGVFTAPIAMPILAEVFESAGALDRLEGFTSEYGARFYGLSLNAGTCVLVREPWQVPDAYAGVVPYRAGEMLTWRDSSDAKIL